MPLDIPQPPEETVRLKAAIREVLRLTRDAPPGSPLALACRELKEAFREFGKSR